MRALYRKLSDNAEHRQRGRLVASIVHGSRSSTPTVYFLTPDFDSPAGGIRVIYRHVDILNAAGINARVLHQKPGFRCTWFEHETKIVDVGHATISEGDLLVVSELEAELLKRLPSGTRHVIFNQNSHLTWQRATTPFPSSHDYNPDLVGVVTVSDHNRDMLRCLFPGCLIHRIHLSIDPLVFRRGIEPAPRRIAYMPRRGRDDARQVFEMLNGRGALDGWELCALDGLSHAAVAERLRETRIFLAFTYQEGFGLPAAEAMACGNYVIGHHGFGGREFFKPDFSATVAAGDVLGFVHEIEAAVVHDHEDAMWCRDRGRKASEFIHAEYAPAREREDVTGLYAEMLGLTTAYEQAVYASAS